MLSSAHEAAGPLGMRPRGSRCPPQPDTIGLAACGPVEDADHIIVLGGQGPELMCALLRAGATNVTHLRGHERPEAASATLVIVPRIASLDWLATALPAIRRALLPHGRVVLLAGPLASTRTQVRRMLKLQGLTIIESHGEGQVVSAARP